MTKTDKSPSEPNHLKQIKAWPHTDRPCVTKFQKAIYEPRPKDVALHRVKGNIHEPRCRNDYATTRFYQRLANSTHKIYTPPPKALQHLLGADQ